MKWMFVFSVLAVSPVLAFASEENTAFADISTDSQIARINNIFEKTLQSLNPDAVVHKCQYHTRFFGYSSYGRDTSYGAVCDVTINGTNRTLFMCNDEMIGKFAIQMSGAISKSWIRNFIEKTCPPGG
jgi:hypothetical protein